MHVTMTKLEPPETGQVVRYTIVGLVGLLAGTIIGCVFSHSGPVAPPESGTAPGGPHPRASESRG